MKQTVVLFGSAGLIGYNLAEYLKKDPSIYLITVSGKQELDLRNYIVLKEWFRNKILGCEVVTVINCAADVGGIFKNIKKGEQMALNNMQIDINLFNLSNLYPTVNWITFSSTCAWGEHELAQTFENYNNYPPHASNFSYAMEKRFLMEAVKERRNWLCIVLPNVYGWWPRIFDNIEDAHVVPALIYKFYNHREKTELKLQGTGMAKRQFLYVHDLVSFVTKMLLQFIPGLLVLTPDEEIIINDIASILSERTLIKYKFSETDSEKDGHRRKFVTSTVKTQFTSFKEGFSNFQEYQEET